MKDMHDSYGIGRKKDKVKQPKWLERRSLMYKSVASNVTWADTFTRVVSIVLGQPGVRISK